MGINPPKVSEVGTLMVVGSYTAIGEPDERYRKAIHQLLPPGPALPMVFGDDLYDLLKGLARELVRAEAEMWALWFEMDPQTTAFFIERWEDLCGLPDDCDPAPSVILSDRRASVIARLTAPGVGTIPSFEKLAADLGYSITITEGYDEAARCGVAVCGGSRSTSLYELFRWTVTTAAGSNDNALQCLIDKLKPSHTTVQYIFT